eukprot:TRINITY_DN40127_c0_g1_i1.p1 TRINITY_DN40127_c0_g1~~TRINITY_DN40127_c0_g1_i1.p1  ORF type:complete len:634 (-),score=144.83 TRINITY_DN40127_c0_g1_i1:483-2384(-)
MTSPNKGILTEFSQGAEFFAIATPDGRIKIWNTVNGQLQSEFTSFASSAGDALHNGHLVLDYTCMKWRPISASSVTREKGKKQPLLVLGTGGGDLFAVDTATGQLLWKVADCHPGGVKSISFTSNGQALYSSGADGFICTLDCETGKIQERFRASKRHISCLAVSSDGQKLVTGAAELKLFTLSDKKKLQKFTGHPDTVRVVAFTKDGEHILSSAASERHIAVWACGVSKHIRAASCVLPMDQPPVSFDCVGKDKKGINILAVSEAGVAYLWHSQNMEQLKSTKSSKISVTSRGEDSPMGSTRKRVCILAAKILEGGNEESTTILVAYGKSVKPKFERVSTKHGHDVIIGGSENGTLLASSQIKDSGMQFSKGGKVTVLGPENAEDAIIPKPKLELLDVGTQNGISVGTREMDGNEQADVCEDMDIDVEAESALADRLVQLGVLKKEDDVPTEVRCSLESKSVDSLNVLQREALDAIENALTKNRFHVKKEKAIRKSLAALSASDAVGLLQVLILRLKSMPRAAMPILSLIKTLLLRFPGTILSDEGSLSLLEDLHKTIEPRLSSFQTVFQLHGRLHLIMTQIRGNKAKALSGEPTIVREDEISEDEVEIVKSVEDVSSDESVQSEGDEEVIK